MMLELEAIFFFFLAFLTVQLVTLITPLIVLDICGAWLHFLPEILA